MVFQTNGTLTTDKRTVDDTTTWDTDTDWNAYQSKSGIQVSNGVLKLAEGSSATLISDEEDGDLTEWSGDLSYYSAVSTPVSSGSSYSIEFGTDGSPRAITNTFTANQYTEYRMYIRTGSSGVNNEVVFYDSSSNDALVCLYFNSSIYFSEPNSGFNVNNSPGGTRDSGTGISGGMSNFTWYEVVISPDWANSTLSITANGGTISVDMLVNTVPDAIELNSNAGSSSSEGHIDEIQVVE